MYHLPSKTHCNRRFFRETGEDCGSGGESGGLGDLEFDSPFIAIAGLTDVLKADKEMLMLDIGTFARCGHYLINVTFSIVPAMVQSNEPRSNGYLLPPKTKVSPMSVCSILMAIQKYSSQLGVFARLVPDLSRFKLNPENQVLIPTRNRSRSVY